MTNSNPNIDRDRDRVLKYKLIKDFSFFIRYFFKEYHGKKFVMNDHHLEIIDMLCEVIKGNITRLIINIAPRYSKTEIAVKMFIAYCLGCNGRAKFIHLSYSDTLALDNSEEIKDLVQSEQFQRFFNVKVKVDSKSKKKWYTTAGGGVYATSAGGQVTGFGAGKTDEEDADIDEDMDWFDLVRSFGGAIIIDDPIKPDETDSDIIREKINNRFDSTIRSRVNSRNTPIIVIMQRLHPFDLSGYLINIEPDEWEVLSLPAIKEDGTALWPHKHSIEELQHLRKVNERVFESQYLQDPEPKEGLMFPKDDLNYFDPELVDWDEAEAILGFTDVADDGDDNHSVPYGYLIGNKVYIRDAVFTVEGTAFNVPETIRRTNKHQPEYMQVESNFGGGMYIQLMNIHTKPKLNDVTALIDIVAKQNKHTRINTTSGFLKEHFVFEKNFDKTTEYGRFMNNLCAYRKKKGAVKHDDAPDSLSGLARMFLTYYGDVWSEWEEAMEELED